MDSAILRTKNVSKSFDGLQASKNISLELFPGEIHALIGPNGAGKSTLIKQITGELKPDSGSVYFDTKDVSTLRVAERARMGLARTFQISSLAMEDTVLQNVLLGALGRRGNIFRFFHPVLQDKELLSRAIDSLTRVGLERKTDTSVAKLSHGQRRQLEVAIALTLQPKAFVMDEPMAGLGSSGSKQLTAVLDKLREEAPILLVEHDMDAVFALANRVSVLVYGELIATGTVEEIRGNADVQRAYLGDES